MRRVLRGAGWRQRVKTKTVILATGVEWRRLEAEDVERLIGRGVLYGAARTEAPTVIGKDVFIVGGGNSAGQAAMFFSSYAASVTVLVRGAGLELSMSQYLIEQIAAEEQHHRWSRIRWWCRWAGRTTWRRSARARMAERPVTRKADALFVMIGRGCEDGLAAEGAADAMSAGLCARGGTCEIWAQKRAPFLLETNLPGFFCAGDVRHDSIKRVSSGVGEGSMAIAFMHQYLALQEPGASASKRAAEKVVPVQEKVEIAEAVFLH